MPTLNFLPKNIFNKVLGYYYTLIDSNENDNIKRTSTALWWGSYKQWTRGPEDQGPEDPGIRGPKDQGPEDPSTEG